MPRLMPKKVQKVNDSDMIEKLQRTIKERDDKIKKLEHDLAELQARYDRLKVEVGESDLDAKTTSLYSEEEDYENINSMLLVV